MNLKQYLTLAFFLSLISAAGFGIIALLISDKKIEPFDSTIISWVQGFESPTPTRIMKFFTAMGAGWEIVVIAAIAIFFLYFVLHHRYELILFVGTMVGSVLLNTLLKMLFHRARPILHRIIDERGFSFPSGHSMAAFTLYSILAFLLWKHITFCLGKILLLLAAAFMIIMIGVSRIYLGVHYPSDVLGGYLASCCWVTASIWFYQRFRKKQG